MVDWRRPTNNFLSSYIWSTKDRDRQIDPIKYLKIPLTIRFKNFYIQVARELDL